MRCVVLESTEEYFLDLARGAQFIDALVSAALIMPVVLSLASIRSCYGNDSGGYEPLNCRQFVSAFSILLSILLLKLLNAA